MGGYRQYIDGNVVLLEQWYYYTHILLAILFCLTNSVYNMLACRSRTGTWFQGFSKLWILISVGQERLKCNSQFYLIQKQ